jgi:hypothetical protein
MTSSIRSQRQYTAAASLTQFFLARGGRDTFLQFVEDGGLLGWEYALQTHYRIRNIQELQVGWEQWAGSKCRPDVCGKGNEVME